MTDIMDRLEELERMSRLRREQTPPENGPAIAIECDTFDALTTALRARDARVRELEGARPALRFVLSGSRSVSMGGINSHMQPQPIEQDRYRRYWKLTESEAAND